MRRTRISIYRPDQTLYAQHIWCEVTQASDHEVMLHQQVYNAHGADIFKLSTDYNPVSHLLNKDLLVDEGYTDPVTGKAMQFRVVGRVRLYDDHDEAYCEVIRGN